MAAVEVFDTNLETARRVLARHGDALQALMRAGSTDVEDRVGAVVAAIRADGDHAYVESALVTYYKPRGRYLTIDIVDREDSARRMPFSAPPAGTFADPEELIATWQRYEETFFDLANRGAISLQPVVCPVFHCLGDPQHPALRALAAKMSAEAPRHMDELATILRDDHRAEYREAAAFLLAYAADGNAVVAHLVPALHDASFVVRNNAMRVLAEIALHHPEIEVPLAPVIEALGYAATTDRNKAAAILDRLLDHPGGAAVYPRVAREAGRILLAMLHLQQPNNHDFAYRILKKISGRTYGEREYAAWQAWLDQVPAE